MKTNHGPLPQLRLARVKAIIATILFIIINLNQNSLSLNLDLYNSQSSPDEDINLRTRGDYESSVAEPAGLLTSRKNWFENYRHRQTTLSTPTHHHDDQLETTFDDFLKEASQISVHQLMSHANGTSKAAIHDRVGLIVEEDDSPVQLKDSAAIDYIFPSPKKESSVHHHEANDYEKPPMDAPYRGVTPDEAKPLFAWKSLLTNKCTKTCGRGFRVNHISCVDLKYKVRVEHELCAKHSLTRPNDISDEPCNTIDCPPVWEIVEFRECSSESTRSGKCHTNLYKRVQCAVINKDGLSIQVDESDCDPSIKPTSSLKNHDENISVDQSEAKDVESNQNSESSDFNTDLSFDEVEKNDILQHARVDSYLESLLHEGSSNRHQPHEEPFFQVGPWSKCIGHICGRLGIRTRKVECRLYLSRSSKFAELPDSTCQNSPKPDIQEPCYIDCAPDDNFEGRNASDYEMNDGEINETTFYEHDEKPHNRVNQTEITEQNQDAEPSDANVDLDLNDLESNDILPNIKVDGLLESLLDRASSPNKHHSHNEPFFEVGPWSKCLGATCGHIGTRSRKVLCRFYLSRSSKFVELPSSGCQNSHQPHSHEPCYIDCTLEDDRGQKKDSGFKDSEYTDEIIYDQELTRFIWKRDGWTRCSSNCLGGQRESVHGCWDKVAEVLVDSDLCDPGSKPPVTIEVCNNIPCNHKWKLPPPLYEA